ncbi:MAG: allantoicase [Kineosporiaceae bacterium]
MSAATTTGGALAVGSVPGARPGPGELTQTLTDLASAAIGATVVHADDELFADRRHLIDPRPSQWQPGYGRDGKIYDGWETRRRRLKPGEDPASACDTAIVRLGAPGVVRHVVVDTAHFKGNYPATASVEGLSVEGYPSPEELREATWTTLVPRSPLKGDTANGFDVDSPRRWTHVRLTIYPDGGVARLRVLGEVVPDPRLVVGTVDLLALQLAGQVVGCSNMFFSSPANLIRPGAHATIAEGWETARRRDGGNDWVLFRLGLAGAPRLLEIDTSLYTGNAPGEARLRGIDARVSSLDDEAAWVDLLPRTRLQPDTLHRFRLCDHQPGGAWGPSVTHARLDVYPDGGVGRVRLFGEVDAAARTELGRRWLATLPVGHLREVLGLVPGLSAADAERVGGGSPAALQDLPPALVDYLAG